MDFSSGSDKSECQDVSAFGGLQSSSFKENHCLDSVDCDLVNQLETTLHVKEVEQVEKAASSNEDDVSNVKQNLQCEGHEVEEPKYPQKLLNKSSSFPCSEKEDGELGTPLKGPFSQEASRNAYSRSISLPTPLNLVSAMKGSREKHGASPRKLSVSWAPDVYDPIPTSLSHTFTGAKKQQKSKNNRKNWKNGKKGQKGNSSRGDSGKDKKQRRKASGNSSGYKSVDTRERLTDSNDEFGDLTVGSPDSQSYCGTSFFKNSHTKMHYPVAEAL